MTPALDMVCWETSGVQNNCSDIVERKSPGPRPLMRLGPHQLLAMLVCKSVGTQLEIEDPCHQHHCPLRMLQILCCA